MDSELDPAAEPLAGIRGVKSGWGAESFGLGDQQSNGANQGTRKVGVRAEIDTSAPFGSVKEAVTRFGGSGSWMPYYKVFEEIDIKKVEEQAVRLEKDLIVKELETLDVLEELGTTKKIVEDLKLQLQKQALRSTTILDEHLSGPAIARTNDKNGSFPFEDQEQRMANLNPCPSSSPHMISMELKQAKLNLGKTINDLGEIQTSIECLSKKMRTERTFLQKTRQRLTSKFAGVLSVKEELKHVQPPTAEHDYKAEHLKQMVAAEKTEVSGAILANENTKTKLKTAELRLLAAQKMEEAARAAEAVALAEIKALSGNDTSSGFALPETEKIISFEARTPLAPKSQLAEGLSRKVEVARLQKREVNITGKMSALRKLREAAEEVKQSKQALEEALNKVEMANKKQSAAEEAVNKWIPKNDQDRQLPANYANLHLQQASDHQESRIVDDDPKRILRSTISMRDVLGRKQVLPEEYVMARPTTEVREERQKVALSQMLQELKFRPRAEKDSGDHQKTLYAQRRKFGFIHISLPMTKPSKKKMQDLNNIF